MTADQEKASYRKALQQLQAVRRYAGPISARTFTDYSGAANAQAYAAKDLIGPVILGDIRLVIYADDLTDAGLTLPVTTNDKAVVDGRELAIMNPMPRRALDGTVIAYELQVRG